MTVAPAGAVEVGLPIRARGSTRSSARKRPLDSPGDGTGFRRPGRLPRPPTIRPTGVYLVAWSDQRSTAGYQVFGTRGSAPEGPSSTPNGIMLNLPRPSTRTGRPVVFRRHETSSWCFSATVGSGALGGSPGQSGPGSSSTPLRSDVNNNSGGQYGASAATDGSTTLVHVVRLPVRQPRNIYGARVQGANRSSTGREHGVPDLQRHR